MNKQETHVVTGMSRDMSVTRFNPNLVVDARNIRITTQGDKATLLVVTNEKGTKEMTLSAPIKGCIIGNCVIDNTLILFTVPYDGDDRDDDYFDYIYKITNINANIPTVTPIFKGFLGFSSQHPIETTAVIENENIKKVYWVDGINQPRMININKEYQDDDNDAFDFCQKVEFNHSFTVEKNTTGGEFPVGTIQYCFSYFNLNGQETNLIETSPLYYLSPADRGLPADSRCTNSFLIKIGNADTSFDYVRLYSIIRTSENATPNCRIVGDYKITDEIVITDNGTIGSTIDPTALYFIGGKSIIAGTLDQKDNTLFLGNIKTNVPTIGNLELNSHTISELSLQETLLDSGAIESTAFVIDDYKAISSGKFYDEVIDNKESSLIKKGFKTGENYRLGFIAQYKTGEWSDAVWLGDVKETACSGGHFFNSAFGTPTWSSSSKRPGFSITLPVALKNLLKNNGFVSVAPVVVFPKDAERAVVCQGILSGTVFNVKDRADNSPFVQADWRFRWGYSWNSIDHEIQCNECWDSAHSNPILPQKADTTTEAFVKDYHNYYYRDPSILTFHSPDIEFNENISDAELENTYLEIVGFSNSGFSEEVGNDYGTSLAPEQVAANYFEVDSSTEYSLGSESTARALTTHFNLNYTPTEYAKKHNYSPNTRFEVTRENLCYPGIIAIGIGTSYPQISGTVLGLGVATYLWGVNSQLQYTNNSRGQATFLAANGIKKQCTSELRYATTTYFDAESSFGPFPYNVNIYSPVIFDSQNVTIKKIKAATSTNADKSVLYYGNIDKVLANSFNLAYFYERSGNGSSEDAAAQVFGDIEDLCSTWNQNTGSVAIQTEFTVGGNTTTIQQVTPVRIKYKSTKHAVISLRDASLMSDPETPLTSAYWNISSFPTLLNAGLDDTALIAQDAPYNGLYNSVLIGELRRDTSTMTLFGGKSLEAFANNAWVKCGYSTTLNTERDVVLEYIEGDTYFGRYDCLKVYPFTQEDQNSIVSIYSTELESRVNLDLRYDKNRGLQDNTLVTPQNFNLFNRAGYNQTNQFFTYQSLNTDRYNVDYFPNMVTWSLEKSFGEDVDTWTSMPLTSTLNLDGDKGGVTELVTWNDNIFAFQKDGFAQLLFNSRVQIPVSDGQPIEITNGLKMSGKRYISENIGCFNKWSVCTTPLGIYFIDDVRKALYNFNGQLSNLSQQKGFETWTSEHCNLNVWNPELWENIVTFYDEINRDIYFVSEEEALIYSEKLGNFISFLDYDKVFPMVNVDNDFYSFKSDGLYDSVCWKMWAGDYNYFFGDFKPFWLTFVSNTDPTVDKVYNTLDWRSTTYTSTDGDSGILNPLVTFDALRVWNDYQDTMQQVLVNDTGTSSNLRKKFNVFRAIIPRDKRAELTESLRDRIRSPWVYIQLSKTIPNKDLMVFNDLTVNFFE